MKKSKSFGSALLITGAMGMLFFAAKSYTDGNDTSAMIEFVLSLVITYGGIKRLEN